VEVEELKELLVYIESIDAGGLMEIRYSDFVVPLANITNVTKDDFFVVFDQLSEEED